MIVINGDSLVDRKRRIVPETSCLFDGHFGDVGE